MRRARLAQHAARRRLAEIPRQASADQDCANLQQPLGILQNGNVLHYAPPPRKKQGRAMGQSYSVDRLYSNASSHLSQHSEASEISADDVVSERRGEFSTSTRFSRFIKPATSSTEGLISCFG